MNTQGLARLLLLAGTALVAPACARDTARPDDALRTGPHVAAVVEIRFENIGAPTMSSSALVAGSVAELEALRAARARGDVLARDLTLPGGPTTGRVTIQLDSLLTGSFTHSASGMRYVQATYRVRNARATDSTVYDTPRRNLTFVAVATSSTINQTAVSTLRRADGSNAAPALALQVLPTGLAQVDSTGAVGSAFADVMQVLAESEIVIDVPTAVTEIFPYGFVVRRTGSTLTRMLDPSPLPDQFDGIVNFAFRIPLQANAADNPTTLSVVMLALDDSDTRLTQSLEEQLLSGRRASRARASSLQVSNRTLLPGGTFPVFGGYRTICSVRTAGSAATPRAHLINVASRLLSLLPDANGGRPGIINRTSSFRATFSAPLTKVSDDNLIMRGLQSGAAFIGKVFDGNGTNVVVMPPAAFFAGEEVEYVATNEVSCPQPQAGRLRVATAVASGTLSSAAAIPVGENPSALAAADLNNDDIVDVVVANDRSRDISVLLGKGDGTFAIQANFDVGSSPSTVAIADLNDDGNADVAVTNQATVSVLLGNGDGTFRTRNPFNAGGQLRDLVIGDLNGDGILDIVVARQNSISVFLGDGDGTFPENESFPAGNPFGVSLGDINGDGNLDIVAANPSDDAVSVLLGNGDGIMQSARSFPAGNEPGRVAIADFNGDGHQDVVVASAIDGEVTVLLGHGDGDFQLARTTIRDQPSNAFGLAVGDLNGDNNPDVIVAHNEEGLSVWLGRGDGTFTPEQTYLAEQARAVTAADVDRNDILDIIVANDLRAGTISVHLGVR